MKEFKERIEKFARDVYSMGQTRFEDHCCLAHGTISAIKTNGPSASVIMRIAVACPELNLNWLFRGPSGGEMLLDSPAPRTPAKKTSPAVNVENVQAVFVTNWQDLQGMLESAVNNALRK